MYYRPWFVPGLFPNAAIPDSSEYGASRRILQTAYNSPPSVTGIQIDLAESECAVRPYRLDSAMQHARAPSYGGIRREKANGFQ
jgi:hypothetical protein